MTLKFLTNTLCTTVFATATLATAQAQTVPGEYLVKLKKQSKSMFLSTLADDLAGAELEVVAPEQNIVLVKADAAKISNGDVVERLLARRDVEHIQPNYRYRILLHVPQKTKTAAIELPMPRLFSEPGNMEAETAGADPLLKRDHDIDLANARKAWKVTRGKRDVVVAVIDSGVDYKHEDLAANMWHDPNNSSIVGWDFIEKDNDPNDILGDGNPGHGTHCAGNVGAVGQNGIGTSGIAQKVSIMALRSLDENGAGETSAGLQAIDWAVDHGANIISASWGSEGLADEDQLMKEAIMRAQEKGVLFVAAAGNTSSRNPKDADNDNNPNARTYPASFDLPNIISVAASNQKGELANFSHFGATTVHMAAPGERSFSTVPGESKYQDVAEMDGEKISWNGTSMATPQVAGAAALLLSKNRKWDYVELKKRLLETVRPEPTLKGKTISGGVLDVTQALKGL